MLYQHRLCLDFISSANCHPATSLPPPTSPLLQPWLLLSPRKALRKAACNSTLLPAGGAEGPWISANNSDFLWPLRSLLEPSSPTQGTLGYSWLVNISANTNRFEYRVTGGSQRATQLEMAGFVRVQGREVPVVCVGVVRKHQERPGNLDLQCVVSP